MIGRSKAADALPRIALLCSLGWAIPGTVRAETLAGTSIVNIAGLRYDLNGANRSIVSNTVTLIVAERLDVRLVRDGEGALVVGPPSAAKPTIVPLTLTNSNNGSEAFALTATISSGMAIRAVVIDADGDGLYDPRTDLAPVDDATPLLAPGQSIKLLVIVAATESGAIDATLTVAARAITGSGAKGTTYAGKGDGGGDAVVGATGATASVEIPLTTTAIAGPALIKSQSVRAADGSQNAVRNAVITYTLQARFTDAVAGARIADPIPEGTVFVPGSLSLDGAPLTDIADGDPGTFDAGALQSARIAVSLGQVAAASVHTVQFKAKIQ